MTDIVCLGQTETVFKRNRLYITDTDSLSQTQAVSVTDCLSQTQTLLLALPAERVRQVLRLQVGSSERKVQVVFVISLDVSVIPSN